MEDVPSTPEQAAEVRAVLDAFDRALDAGDYVTAAALCLPDLTFFGSGAGEEARSAHALAPMLVELQERVADLFLGWSLDFDGDHDVTVRDDAALVVGVGRCVLTTTREVRSSRYLLTVVLHRTGDGWRIWSFHGSEPQPW